MTTPTQLASNRANALHSTGPATAEGKSASSRNAVKHGLASRQLIIEGEEAADYEALLADLTREHAPATPTEILLVNEMAQNYWFMQRCVRLYQIGFARTDLKKALPWNSMPLIQRYQSASSRGFYKALNTLLTLRKQTSKPETGFVSQNAAAHPPDTAAVAPPSAAIAAPAPEIAAAASPLPPVTETPAPLPRVLQALPC